MRSVFILFDLNTKIEINSKLATPIIETILEHIGFVILKRYKKENFLAEKKESFLKQTYCIDICRINPTKEYLLNFYFDAKLNKLISKTKLLLIALNHVDSFFYTIAEELNIQIIDLKHLIYEYLDNQGYDQLILTQDFYHQPLFSFRSMSLTVEQVIQKICLTEKEHLFVIEGQSGVGKTSFLKYLTKLIGQDYFNKNLPLGFLPLLIDAFEYKNYDTLSSFILQEGFLKNQLKPSSLEYSKTIYQFPFLILVCDNIEQLYSYSHVKMLFFLQELNKLLQNSFVKVILNVSKDFFDFSYRHQKYIKSFYEHFFNQIPVVTFTLEPSSLMQIKKQIDDFKLQSLIQQNIFLRKVANNPLVLNFLTKLPHEKVEQIINNRTLFEHLLSLWPVKYLTDLGKETLMEIFSFLYLLKGQFSLENIPDYIENFVKIEYKEEAFSINLLADDLKASPFFLSIGENLTFINAYFAYYYIAQVIKTEIEYGKYENIDLLKNEMIYKFILDNYKQESIINILYSLIRSTTNQLDKGKKFQLLYHIIQYSNQKPLLIKELHLAEAVVEYECMSKLYLVKSNLQNSTFYECDLRFLKGKDLNLNQSHFENSDYSYSEFIKSTFHNAIMEKSCGRQTQFIECELWNINFFEAKLVEAQFHKTTISESSFHGAILVKAVIQDCEIVDTDFSNVDAYQSHFFKAILKKMEINSMNLTKSEWKSCQLNQIIFQLSVFYQAIFEKTVIEQIDFSVNILQRAQFLSCTFSDVSFLRADLRNTNFKGSHLTNVDFSKADLRESNIMDPSVTLCEKTRKSLEKAILH